MVISKSNGSMVYGCMTHIPLWVEFPSFVSTTYLGDAPGEGKLNLRDLAPEWAPYHPILGGTAGTFALKNYILKYHPVASNVGICQYRKFISRTKLGTPSTNYSGMHVLAKSELAQLSLHDLMGPDGTDFLIGRPIRFIFSSVNCNYLYQYMAIHHVEDFLRFTAEAVELAVLEKQEVNSFFEETVFFPGGVELGIFPADFWLKIVTAIESVVRVCVRRYPAARKGYQARAWAFCVERLGSYLLLKHLRTNYANINWQNEFIGHLNLITEDDSLNYVPET